MNTIVMSTPVAWAIAASITLKRVLRAKLMRLVSAKTAKKKSSSPFSALKTASIIIWYVPGSHAEVSSDFWQEEHREIYHESRRIPSMSDTLDLFQPADDMEIIS